MYKKIFLGLMIAVGLTSCSEDFTNWSNPQESEGDAAKYAQLDVTAVDPIVLANVTEDSIIIYNHTFAADETPTSLTYKVKLTNEKGESAEIEATAEGKVATADLTSAVEMLYGKRPVAREIQAIVDAYAVYDTHTILKEGKVVIVVTPVAPEIFPNLYVIGAPTEWSANCTTMKFTHSDKDVYDDPVFTTLIPVAAGTTEMWFAFADDKTVETNDWSNVFGACEGNGNNKIGETGRLARRSELSDEGSFKVTFANDAKFVKVTVNMLDGTYLLEKVNYQQFIYFIGATDGWKNDETKRQRLESPSFDGKYTGYIYVADPNSWGLAFKFQTTSGSWDDQINAGNFTSMEGCSGSDNIEVSEAGLYYMEVDLANNSIKTTHITNMNLVGDFNGWKEDDATQQMTWNATDYCYEITGATVNSNGWKFTANNAWTINLGGSTTELVGNGADLKVVGTTIKLYPTRRTNDKIVCTVE